MASTEFGVNDAQTVKHWSRKTLAETFGMSYFRKFAGTGKNSIIRILNELESGPGDTIKYDLRTQHRGKGIAGDSEMRGFEAALTYYQDTVLVNQLRQAHEFGQMSQQRTVHDLRQDGMESLAEWWRGTFDATTFSYLAGTVGTYTTAVANESYSLADTTFSGNTLRTATNTIDGSSADFDLSLIPRALEMAKTLNPRIEPTMVDGEPKYVLVLHPVSVASMQLTTGESQWAMIQQRAAARGSKNPIYTGALGEYLGVVLHESEFIPRDTDDRTYNLFLGANAGAFAMANAYKKIERGQSSGGGGYFRWHEDTWDYGNRQGVAGSACWGVQKAQFNSIDRGVITIETTDASHETV